VHGKELLEANAPCLIVTNHQSLFDIPVAFEAISGDIRMVAKKELFYIPVLGQIMHAGNFIPILRGDKKSSGKVVDQVKTSFSKGIRVWVAPEGSRSIDGSLGRFKWGSFALAIEAGVPIQPLAVLNSRLAMSKTSWLPSIGKTIDVHIIDPVQTKDLSQDDKPVLCTQIQEKIQQVLNASNQ